MNENWKIFIQKYGSIHFAKDAFEELCGEILDIHFPGRKVINYNNLKNEKTKGRQVIFLPKFYTENISNSRKSQIRKEFGRFIEYKNNNKSEVLSWVLCIPHSPDEEEMKWWLSWSEKQSKENIITLELFDGDFIVEKAKKYGLYDRWFLKEEEKIAKEESSGEKEEVISLTLIPDNEDNSNTKEKEEDNKDDGLIVIDEEKIDIDDEKYTRIDHVKLNYSLKYDKLKEDYKRILKLTDKFSKEEIDYLQNLHSSKNCFKLFIEDEEQIKNLNVLKLFYRAKSNEVNKHWDKALFFYEKVVQDKKYQESLRLKVSEIIKSINNTQTYIQSILYEFEGDILRITSNNEESLKLYEKAFKLVKKNKTYAKKYYEQLADIKLKKEEYAEAVDNYSYALDNSKSEEIEEKKEMAEHLLKGERNYKFLPFISLVHFSKAYKISPEDNIYKKYKKSSNKSIAEFSIILILIISLFFISIKFPQYKIALNNLSIKKQTNTVKKNDVLDIAEQRAEQIIANYSIEKIYLVDTAIALYQYILDREYSSEITKKIQEAIKIKQNYIDIAQKNIKANPEQYFVSLRSFSEGVQLFKYIYDPSQPKKGKYGYVDYNKNIIIPPVYDFNSKIMYDGKENFHNGKAIVCLRTEKKEIFLQIDLNNNVLRKYDISVFF